MGRSNLCAAGLAVIMTLALAACGGSGEQTQESAGNAADAADGYVWVAEYIELSGDTDIYNGVYRDGSLYAVTDNWDEEGNHTDTTFDQISVTDGTVTKAFSIDRTQTDITDENGNSSSRYCNYYGVTKDGNFITLDSAYTYNLQTYENSTNYYLCYYSATGELINEIDITGDVDPDDSGYVQRMLLDGEDRICVALETAFLLYDADGNLLGRVELGTSDGWIQSVGLGGDGQIYFAFYDYGSGSGKVQLGKLDFDAKSVDTSLENSPDDANWLTAGESETELIIGTQDSVYRYDTASQTSELLFDWLDSDIYGTYVMSLDMMEDGRLLATLYGADTDGYELAILTRTEASEVAQKTEIVLGSLYDDSDLKSQIVKFNKANDQYHITFRTYVDYSDAETDEDYTNALNDAYTRLNNEITSNDCPDLLMLDELNVEQLAAKGVFEDLTPYLESSSALSREDFFENILEAYTYEDQLIGIPQSFHLMTIAGKTSEVGEEPGWTLDELMAYADEHPDAQIFDYSTKEYMLRMLIAYSQSKYIDWETGICSFDQENFSKVLEFANRFPEEYTYDEDAPSTPNMLASGQLLLDLTTIYQADEIQVEEAMFGEPVTYIGFPNEDGASGTYMKCSSSIAITAKSEHKDAAWAFIESFLTQGGDDMSFGFSSRKENFEEQLAESMTTDYTDENGDPYLNEDGYALTGGGMSYGDDDWSYDYRVTTEEEAAQLRNMIETAQPSSTMDSEILSIITEEADSYFSGDKSAEDAAAVIQSRVQIYVNEQK